MSKSKSGLGRGFDSLIPQNFDSSLLMDESERIQKLLIQDVRPNPKQPRRDFDESALADLAVSIKMHGILQPIVVTPEGEGFLIIAGERRWRAAQQAGLSHIPAIVRTMQELEQLEVALVENIQRVDLSPLEQAASILNLHQQFSLGYEAIAQRLGKAISTVNNLARLLQLPENAQAALKKGQISEGHARALLSLKDDAKRQQELLGLIISNGWSVRQAEQFVTAMKKGAPTAKVAQQRTQSENEETKALSKHLKTPVSVQHMAKGGRLVISFISDKDLERILQQLLG